MFVVFCRLSWIIERGNLLCAGYASTSGYASKLRLRVPALVVFCHQISSRLRVNKKKSRGILQFSTLLCLKLSTIVDVFLEFVVIKESSDFGVLYVVCLATNARLHHHV